MSGQIQNITMEIKDLSTYFKTRVKAKDLETKIKALEQPMIEAINFKLRSGVPLSIANKQIKRDYSLTELFLYDDYLLI